MSEDKKGSDGGLGRSTIVLVVLFFTVLTVLFTYPISTSPNRYLNELTDSRLATWMMAWNAHAFATGPQKIFKPNVYFPDEATKASSESFLLPSVIVAPLNWAGYPVLAYNLVLLSSFVLTGVGMTLWVRYMTGSLSAGVLAGIIWAFAPGKFDQVAHLHMMVGQWIPFALLYCGRYLESGRNRHLFATVAFTGVQIGFSMHYGAFMVPFLGLYAVALLLLLPDSQVRANLSRFRKQLAIAAVVFVLLAVAVGLPYLRTHEEVGLRRGYEETLLYSGRADSFLSGSTHNVTPHVAWLYQRYHVEDSSYFAGIVPFALAAFALLVLWPGTLRASWQTPPSAGVVGVASWGRVLRWVSVVAAAVAAAALALHFVGLFAAWTRGTGLAAWIVSLCLTVHPAMWAGVAATVALLTMVRPAVRGASRQTAYLIVVGYLAVIFYLLAYGPEVQAFRAQLGHGPYWLLYRLVLPFQIIRSAGRIGLLWMLCVAALAGFALAFLERRWQRATAESRGPAVRYGWGAVLALLLVVIVWEYRTWPLRHFPADPAADPADVWLAEQPGDFAVMHAPLEKGQDAGQETAYMLGSTLHWKNLVNGYLRYAPLDYRELADTEQLGPEFFRQVRAGFPVRYLLVHEDRLDRGQQRNELPRLLRPNDDAIFMDQFGYTLVFEVPGAAADGPLFGTRARGGYGFRFRRRFSEEQLAPSSGVRFSLRGSRLSRTEDVIALAEWGGARQVIEVDEAWQDVDIPMPALSEGSAAGDPAADTADLEFLEIWGHALRPVGETGASVISGFTIDVGPRGATVGIHDEVLHFDPAAGISVSWLVDLGHQTVESRVFATTPEGAAEMLAYVDGLPEGALVGASVVLDSFRLLDPDAASALRLIGVAPPKDEETLLLAALGVRGAAPGTALEHFHHTRAVIDIEAPTPVLQVRDISLY